MTVDAYYCHFVSRSASVPSPQFFFINLFKQPWKAAIFWNTPGPQKDQNHVSVSYSSFLMTLAIHLTTSVPSDIFFFPPVKKTWSAPISFVESSPPWMSSHIFQRECEERNQDITRSASTEGNFFQHYSRKKGPR